MAKAADCKSAMSRFESGRRLCMDAGLTAKSCTVNGVNVVALGGINIPYPCTDACRRGVRVDRFFLFGKGGAL